MPEWFTPWTFVLADKMERIKSGVKRSVYEGHFGGTFRQGFYSYSHAHEVDIVALIRFINANRTPIMGTYAVHRAKFLEPCEVMTVYGSILRGLRAVEKLLEYFASDM